MSKQPLSLRQVNFWKLHESCLPSRSKSISTRVRDIEERRGSKKTLGRESKRGFAEEGRLREMQTANTAANSAATKSFDRAACRRLGHPRAAFTNHSSSLAHCPQTYLYSVVHPPNFASPHRMNSGSSCFLLTTTLQTCIRLRDIA